MFSRLIFLVNGARNRLKCSKVCVSFTSKLELRRTLNASVSADSRVSGGFCVIFDG